MSLARRIKGGIYPWLPSLGRRLHEKRRKGLSYRHVSSKVLECQTAQDQIFWEKFLHRKKQGSFVEIGIGDGVVGSQTLGLELMHDWKGAVFLRNKKQLRWAQEARKCWVRHAEKIVPQEEPMNLLAVHEPLAFPQIWAGIKAGRVRPDWVVVHNREPDPQWCQLLQKAGYQLKLYFHDDEYYQLRNKHL